MRNVRAPALAIGLTVSALARVASIACGPGDARAANPTKAEPAGTPAKTDAVKRGEYLVTIMGCSDCHTPMKMGANGPEPDMTRFLSGHPEQMGALKAPKMEGPWLMAGALTNTAY